jgi:protein involved in polysaccharide export with SLBB domain
MDLRIQRPLPRLIGGGVRSVLVAAGLKGFALSLPLLAIALIGACATPGRPMTDVTAEINASRVEPGIVLGPGDVLSVRFPELSDWNHETIVRPDGKASFLLLDDMRVAGLTVDVLDRFLTEAYRPHRQSLTLTVMVTSIAPRSVTVLGEVRSPGAVNLDLNGHLTLVEALARAGGIIKETALMKRLLLVRWDAHENRQLAWEMDARPDQWTGEVPILLQPYDVIYVPNTPVDNVAIFVDQYIRRMIPFPQVLPTVITVSAAE